VTRVEHVSDTALWVATYRAMESERPDALFRDPYAARLAGERGRELLESVPWARRTAWAMIVRTAVLDELIRQAIERHGITRVVNLAAGLDARPWRMTFPPDFAWVDVDLPGILDHKGAVMEAERPACRLETVRIDLSDREARRALFARLGADERPTLVLSEGLLIYLEPADVARLADDLHAIPVFRWWLVDLASPRLLEMMRKRYGKGMDPGKVPFRFAPPEGTAFFASHGWREAEVRFNLDEAHRLGREMKGAWIPRLIGRLFPNKAEEFRRMGMTVLLERD
jgi:methyltransferase (TIGR00027 family)